MVKETENNIKGGILNNSMKNPDGNKRVIVFFLCMVILQVLQASIISAQINPSITSEPTFEQGKEVTIPLPCTIRGGYCSVNATCRTTIINPINDVLVNNQLMERVDAVFTINLTANQTEVLGEYQFNVVCSDDGNSASRFLIFYVTPNGEQATTGKGMMYGFLLVVLVVLFILGLIGGIKFEHISLKYFFFLGAYLLFIGITFIAWNLSLDYLTSAPFLTSFFRILWWVSIVALFPILLIGTFYTIWVMIQMKEIQRMIDKGIPSDEAYERTVRNGMKGFGRVKW